MERTVIHVQSTRELVLPMLPNHIGVKVGERTEMMSVGALSQLEIDAIIANWSQAFRDHCGQRRAGGL